MGWEVSISHIAVIFCSWGVKTRLAHVLMCVAGKTLLSIINTYRT